MKQKIVLHFPSMVTEQPFTYYLIKEYNLMVNILKANINPRKEGRMVVEVSGDSKNYKGRNGVSAIPGGKDIPPGAGNSLA